MPPIAIDNAPALFDGVRYVRRQQCGCDIEQFAADEQARADAIAHAKTVIMAAGLQSGKLATFRFGTFDPARNGDSSRSAIEYVQKYCEEVEVGPSNWLYIYGPYGVGKTHLAVAALRKIAATRLWSPYMAVWPTLCSQVKESWRKDTGTTEAQLWGKMRHSKILLIDDIDKGKYTAWQMGKLFEIINHRTLKQWPTVITANHSIEALAVEWDKGEDNPARDSGGAIISRIGGQLWGAVEITGRDQRWK